MPEWREILLRDICDSVDYGLTASASREPVGPKFLRITDIVNDLPNWDEVPFVDATSDQTKKYQLHSGDIVIARTGATTGYSKWINEPPQSVFASYLVRLKLSSEVSPRYVGYLLKSSQFKAYVAGVLGDKSAQPNASASTLTAVQLRIPACKSTQEGIAAVLGALDDKVAIDRQLAAKSRVLAQEHFRAVISTRAEAREISSVAKIIARGVTPRYSEEDDQMLILNQKCIRGGRIELRHARRTLAGRVPTEKLLEANDILVNSTGVGTLGRVARWTLDMQCTVDSHITIVRFDDTRTDPVCAGFAMLAAQPEIETLGEGSTGQTELSRAKLSSLYLKLPTSAGVKDLRPRLNALEARAEAALVEAASLSRLRDTLLPKLMSGELRVRDAEKVAEEVT